MHDLNARVPPSRRVLPALRDIPDLICLSHLRWRFVLQRPQHLMTRYARTRRVFFIEEPRVEDVAEMGVTSERIDGVTVVTPQVPHGWTEAETVAAQRRVLDQVIARERISRYTLWYYTPLALRFASHLTPAAVAYDCMDELSAFKGASAELPALERELLARADVVFTGGHSLYEAKKHQHHNMHAVPSSVDVAHFAKARQPGHDPQDQRGVAGPRLGFFGVLDERLDIPLLAGMADARPDWQFMMIGPVVKIDPADLPRRPNIHYLGSKSYGELPGYIAGWDVALLLFARNEATRFISPTKTPEYLAAGKPVVSTSIRDVVHPYGERRLVYIADTVPEMVRACSAALEESSDARRVRADAFLDDMSWDKTWARTAQLMDAATTAPARPATVRAAATQTLSVRA